MGAEALAHALEQVSHQAVVTGKGPGHNVAMLRGGTREAKEARGEADERAEASWRGREAFGATGHWRGSWAAIAQPVPRRHNIMSSCGAAKKLTISTFLLGRQGEVEGVGWQWGWSG